MEITKIVMQFNSLELMNAFECVMKYEEQMILVELSKAFYYVEDATYYNIATTKVGKLVAVNKKYGRGTTIDKFLQMSDDPAIINLNRDALNATHVIYDLMDIWPEYKKASDIVKEAKRCYRLKKSSEIYNFLKIVHTIPVNVVDQPLSSWLSYKKHKIHVGTTPQKTVIDVKNIVTIPRIFSPFLLLINLTKQIRQAIN